MTFIPYISPTSELAGYEILTVFRRPVMNEVIEFLSRIEERAREIIRSIVNR